MRILTFLAGVATGLLLQRSTADRAAGPRAQRVRAGTAAGDDDEAWLPPRTDAQVRERIESQLRRTLSDPGGIQVEVSNGCVTLRGRVQERDAVLLMTEVASTAGVRSVRNRLEPQGANGGVEGTPASSARMH